jgi:teichuronic acid biosynthesis glycosyltransferase TuaC
VHAHYGLSGIAAIGVDVPLVVSFCGDDLLGRPNGEGRLTLKSRALVRLSARAAHRADAVIVKSEEMRQVIADVPGVHVIPNGVDLARFRRESREAARAALGWRLDGSVLLFAANRDEPRKNFPLALAVERRLRDQGLDVRLEYMFGKPHSMIVQAMNAADVLLLPSFHEGSPNAVKEAMACGLPVVAAPVGDCEELLRNCHPSALAERTEEAFTAATARVLAAQSRSNGRAIIEASLTLEAVARRIIDVYERTLARRRKAA